MSERVWVAEKKGKNTISLRKGSKFHAEGRFTEPGRYVFYFSTNEDRPGPVAIRIVEVQLSLVFNGEVDDPVEGIRTVHKKRQQESYSFTLAPSHNVTWTLSASSQVVLKTIPFEASAKFFPGADTIEDSELDVEEEEKMKLTPEQEAKLAEAAKGWPNQSEFSEIEYPQDKAVAELSRSTIWKQRILELGLIRPFLLFVSMHPKTRLQWAHVLKVNIITSKKYGDSHWEAYKLLVTPRKGIQGRAAHAFTESVRPLKPNPTWYQIIHRVCRKAKPTGDDEKEMKASRKTFKEALTCCAKEYDTSVFRMEEIFSSIIRNVTVAKLEESNGDFLITLKQKMDDRDLLPYIENLKKIGYTEDALMRYIAAVLTFCASADNTTKEWADSRKEGTKKKKAMIVAPAVMIGAQLALGFTSPLTIIPAIMLVRNTAAYVFRETPGRLLSPLIALMKQKDILGYHNICIDDYYQSNIEVYTC